MSCLAWLVNSASTHVHNAWLVISATLALAVRLRPRPRLKNRQLMASEHVTLNIFRLL